MGKEMERPRRGPGPKLPESKQAGDARRRFNRRSLLKAGAAVTAGAAATAAGADASDEGGFAGAVTASTLGVVVSAAADGLELDRQADSRVVDVADLGAAVEEFGEGIRAQPGSGAITVTAPGFDAEWKPGHEAVLLERYVDGEWQIFGVQHLYLPIEGLEVVRRDGSTLETNEDELKLTPGSAPAPEEWTEAESVPLGEIGSGDVVGGLGYRSPDHEDIEVARLGIQEGE